MFLSEDVQKARAFGEFIGRFATWTFGTNDAIALTKHLAWYNTMVTKVEDHVMELQKVIQAPNTESKSKK